VQVSETPIFAFSKTFPKMTPDQREEMKMLPLRIPSHLLDDQNLESDEESSISMEGYYAVGGEDDIDDQSTVTTDGHMGHNATDNLDQEFKNISVSELNNNSVAMETDGQETAIMTREKERRRRRKRPGEAQERLRRRRRRRNRRRERRQSRTPA